MAIINLRELYPVKIIENEEVKNPDCLVEVPDGEVEAFKAGLTEEIADVYFKEQRNENAYQRRMYWYKAQYSLDCDDGIEYDAINLTIDPVFEEYADKLIKQQLLNALDSMPEKQGKRIYAFYFLGMSMTEIAKKESVNKSQISRSIEKALVNIKNILRNLI